MAYNPNLFASVRLGKQPPLKAPEDTPARAGALDAYMIPSLDNGRTVARKRPILMSSSPVALADRKMGSIK